MINNFFSWKPNNRGWWILGLFVLLTYLQGKTLPRLLFELFDYYDYDVVLLNVLWLIVCSLGGYKIIEYNLHKNYGERKDDI